MSRQCLLGTAPFKHNLYRSAALTWFLSSLVPPVFLVNLTLSWGDWYDHVHKKQVSEFMRLSGFHCLERFRVEKIPPVLPEAVIECTENPGVTWLQTNLR